ncbi:hypothetical protein [uncultured Aquimarina sp.]|uniref:hypothetical protein n=1 Tax=uncultured Aquimarina sp. TaxID=575652 RepID=UPI0026196BF3|nr:hypothetical protein [uncultured Aquimarina sp.]
MKKIVLISIITLLNHNLSFSQTKSEINSLLNEISETENSKGITETEQAKRIISFGKNTLLILAGFFTDSTLTKVKSECQKRNLKKGEIAIIMADRIQFMPYTKLTGVENCILTFCEDNSNLIEYYLWAIKSDGVESFKKQYINWLKSEEYKNYTPLFRQMTEKERKKNRKEKRTKRRAKRKN